MGEMAQEEEVEEEEEEEEWGKWGNCVRWPFGWMAPNRSPTIRERPQTDVRSGK